MVGLLALNTVAFAADMPVKAAPKLVSAYPDASGLYWSVGTYGEATKLGVVAPVGPSTSTFAAGGNLSVGGGYVWSFGPLRSIAIEGTINYANTGANVVGVNANTRISGTQRILYLGDLSMFTQWLPNLSTAFPVLPSLPANAPTCPIGTTCNPLSQPYIGAVLHEARNEFSMGAFNDKELRITYGAVLGLRTRLTDGSAVDTWTDITSSSGAHLMGTSLIAKEGVTYRAGLTWHNGLSRF